MEHAWVVCMQALRLLRSKNPSVWHSPLCKCLRMLTPTPSLWARTHVVRDTQPNKYCLPILCHSTPWREASIDKPAQLYLINSLFSLVLPFLSPLLPACLAYISTPCSPSDLAAELLQILSIYPQKHKSSDQPRLVLFLINYFIPSSWQLIVKQRIFHIARFTLLHPRCAQPAAISSTRMCCLGKGQRVTWNLLSQTRLSKVLVLCLSLPYE